MDRMLIVPGLVLAVATIGCESEAPRSGGFFSETCTLDPVAVEPCAECLDFDLAATLGTTDDDGFLVDRGTLGDIVRDHSGNYWVGQREQIKVFDPDGAFVTAVGRAGQGPMEFAFAQPMHTDSLGRVHVFDIGNARVSVIGPDRELHEEESLPATAIEAMTPLSDGEHYAIQVWLPDTEHAGFAIHVVADGEITITTTWWKHGQAKACESAGWRDRCSTTARVHPVRGPGTTHHGTESATSKSTRTAASGLCSGTDGPTGATP